MLMVHCHAIQCFYADFFAVKNGGQELEAAAPANKLQASSRTFLFFKLGASQSIDVGVSVRCQSLSSLAQSRRRDLRNDQESENEKTRLPNNGKHAMANMNKRKMHGNQSRPAELQSINLELSWSDDRSSLAIFQVQLCRLHYKVQRTLRQVAGRTLVARTLFGQMPGCHYFSQKQNGVKITE